MVHVSKRATDGQWQAFLSQDPDTREAVIFVHGYRGHFLKSWMDFHLLIDQTPEKDFWRRTDLFFWGYHSVNGHISASASELRSFLETTFPDPPPGYFSEDVSSLDWREARNEMQQAFVRLAPYSYESIKLVGHSEGAVVIRRLIADAVQEQSEGSQSPLTASSPYLFAPAHLGFRPSGAVGVFFNLTWIGTLIRKLAEQTRSYQHLEPGSPTLAKLRRDTESLSAMRPNLRCLRAFIFWGSEEDVVVAERFSCDQPSQEHWEPGRDHIDVCKPKRSYLNPIKFVRDAMSDAANHPTF